MGFEIPKRTALLTFEGTDYDGAEIRVRLDMSMGFFLEVQEMVGSGQLFDLYSKFGKSVLLEWNLEDEGQPLPCGETGMMALPPALANIIVSSWAEAVAKPPSPLSEPSGDGSMSGEAITLTASG